MPAGTLGLLLALATALAPASQPAEGLDAVSAPSGQSWQLLWSDEFDGGGLDGSKWEAQLASGCQYGIPQWGNGEQQWYTDLAQNLRLENGNLVLQAVYDPAAATVYQQPYTSARVRTFGKFAVAPSAANPTVKVEARIKVPAGLGLWPAFWMLPADEANNMCSGCGRHGRWAASGEIDIMETANDAQLAMGTLHYGGQWPLNSYASYNASLPSSASFADDFHVFGLEWETKQMRWYIDGVQYAVQNSGGGTKDGWFSLGQGGDSLDAAPLPGDGPFGTQQFYLILNLALGGQSTPFTTKLNGGAPVTSAQLNTTLAAPQSMLVDWVRVYGAAAGY